MTGWDAETRALGFLLRKGHVFLARNYRIRGGEIDLITRDRTYIVFTEVKHRTTSSHGSAIEQMTPRKMTLLKRAALHYLGSEDIPCRFDVIAISGDVFKGALEHIENAFS